MIDWWQWHNEPLLVDGIVLLGWLYALAVGPWRRHLAPGEPFPRVPALRFYSGLALFYIAVGSPWSQVAGVFLFSAHMAENLTIMYPVAALVILGLPAWLVDALLGRAFWRRALGGLLHPLVGGALFVVIVTAWHAPRLFELALEEEPVRELEHLLFFVASLLFWWPLLSPSRLLPRLRFGVRMLYLLGLEVALTALFTYILMADHAMYPTYEYAPRLLPGLDAVEDQVLGGVLLSGISSLVMVGALGWSFFNWAKTDTHDRKSVP